MEGWHCLSARNVSHDGKLDLLLDLSIALGLRCPSEHSMQLLAALHKISCEGPEQVRLLGCEEKLQAVRHVKRVFHRKISGLPPPLHHVANLHATSAAFKAEFPQVYASVDKASEPVISPIPEHIMRELQYSFPMRSTKKAAPAPAQMNELLLQQVLQVAGRALGLSGEHCFGGGSSNDPHPDPDVDSSATAASHAAATAASSDTRANPAEGTADTSDTRATSEAGCPAHSSTRQKSGYPQGPETNSRGGHARYLKGYGREG